MLIRNAEVWGHGLADVRIEAGRVVTIEPPRHGEGDHPQDGGGVRAARRNVGRSRHEAGAPPPPPAAAVPLPVPGRIIAAHGAALLPGLHDHHIHLAGLAARAASVNCGPPEVLDEAGLAAQLAARPGTGWLRGIGYHESVMGLPDARALDQLCPARPLRIQHRSGRMWLLNSAALAELLARAGPPAGLERAEGRHTGRLFDDDQWLQAALASSPPDFGAVSGQLAGLGVTGLTDMSPRNDAAIAAHFAAQHEAGILQQNVMLAGALSLHDAAQHGWRLGPAKLHLHEAALPDFDDAARFIAAAHGQQRAVAIHCVSEVELVFALAALEQAGPQAGDRIEHVSVASPALVARIAAMGLGACIQPHFIRERGDAYLRDVEPRHLPDLYRQASLDAAGIVLSGGSDAPFGQADPWLAMRSAVDRRTAAGAEIGPAEALTPERALSLFLADPADLTRQRVICAGAPADLVLLDRPWESARQRLTSSDVRLTVIAGKVVGDGIDQSPGERGARGDALA